MQYAVARLRIVRLRKDAAYSVGSLKTGLQFRRPYSRKAVSITAILVSIVVRRPWRSRKTWVNRLERAAFIRSKIAA